MNVVMNNLDRYYTILGLEPGASLEAVNRAYKDLAFVWHPDRIPQDNPRLLEKAVKKFQQINDARDKLRSIQHSKKQPISTVPKQQPRTPRTRSVHYRQNTYKRPYYKDLTGADLRRADLREKDLSGRNMMLADLSYADLSDGFFHKVNLEGANLFRANLFRINLLQANLKNANLREANLIGADLSGADLRGADLREAKVGTRDRIMVKLTGANLAGLILPNGSIHS